MCYENRTHLTGFAIQRLTTRPSTQYGTAIWIRTKINHSQSMVHYQLCYDGIWSLGWIAWSCISALIWRRIAFIRRVIIWWRISVTIRFCKGASLASSPSGFPVAQTSDLIPLIGCRPKRTYVLHWSYAFFKQ